MARRPLLPFALTLLLALPLSAQSRLPQMPGYEQWQKVGGQIGNAMQSGSITATWAGDSRSFEYNRDGRRFRYDIARRTATDIGAATAASGFGGGPGRGRQFDSAMSPDSTLRALYRDRNLWIQNTDGSGEFAVTTDGSVEGRIKNGSASWVYGEELNQNTAMWWSPSGQKLAFYRFDESEVPDYLLQLDQTELYSTIYTEAYPKAGYTNPGVELFVYDLASRRITRVDHRDGQPLSDDVVGHYVYAIEWSPDGTELLVNRTNRYQNIMELAACSPETGACRTVVREEWPTGWVTNSPTRQFLADGKRFIWASERTGFRNFYLYHLDGRLLATLTSHPFEVANIVRVDERANVLWYMARSGDNHMKMQLHRVGLTGRNDRRLTDPTLTHTANVAPDGRHILAVSQTHRDAPVTRLLDANGRVLATVSQSDLTRYDSLGLKRVELFTFKAADGVTDLHGMLHFPSNFDPSRRYPVLVSVYAGPGSTGARETFTLPHQFTEFGFLVVTMDSRSASGRGRRFLDQIYLKLSQVETDDQAAGIRALRQRPYVDGSRVGIFGTSYGGTVAGMAVLRHGDVFQAAASSAAVVDWRQYDTIYTERYMRTPQSNPEGYDMGDMRKFVSGLNGHLLIYYGSADDNVHPNNQMQLIKALQDAGKSFEVQVGPDRGHSGVNQQRMLEFFIERLVMSPAMVP
ncbi:MAG TPA: DPP IV N-terminal domain-containing protein [Gemmatimonadales bacterium]|nr:DPP IV N-terminal domain-containing protein [Gemmatimonadales bacterium]